MKSQALISRGSLGAGCGAEGCDGSAQPSGRTAGPGERATGGDARARTRVPRARCGGSHLFEATASLLRRKRRIGELSAQGAPAASRHSQVSRPPVDVRLSPHRPTAAACRRAPQEVCRCGVSPASKAGFVPLRVRPESRGCRRRKQPGVGPSPRQQRGGPAARPAVSSRPEAAARLQRHLR